MAKVLLKQTKTILKVLDSGVMKSREFSQEEQEFMAKFSSFIAQRALHFGEVAMEMGVVSFP